MPRPAACLFDLDGLLLDTEPCHGEAWRQAALHFGLSLRDGQLLQLRGRRRVDCVTQVRRWIREAGHPVPTAEALLAHQQPVARRLLPHAPAMPGARRLVEQCRELDVPMAMVTSSSRASMDLKVAPHGWLESIALRILGDDPALRSGKPAPDPFLLACRRLGVAAAGCWAFEDSPAGARSAVAAGCLVHVLAPEGVGPSAYPAQVRWLRSLTEVRLERNESCGEPISTGG
jgi:pseudouridine-5'-monophosphatase